MNFSDLSKNIQQFFRAPSKFPITLTLLTSPLAALIAYFSGTSNVGCTALKASTSLFVGLNLRNTIYDQPYTPHHSYSTILAEDEGIESATSYSDYFINLFNPDAWSHPIIFGRAMFCEMKKNEERIEAKKQSEKMKLL